MSPPNPAAQAPTAAELLADPVVQSALSQAWIDSDADDRRIGMRKVDGSTWIRGPVLLRSVVHKVAFWMNWTSVILD